MTIEERAIKLFGITDNPTLALYMTKEGILINGSYEGYQRDRDHRDISQFFKRSKREQLGASGIYIYKFMNRGNIRMGCSSVGFIMNILTTPTEEQLLKLLKLSSIADRYQIEFGIGVVNRKNFNKVRYMSMYEYIEYLIRYQAIQDYVMQDIMYKYRNYDGDY